MKKKQGFTLIELLAVIIILSIIAVMTVPVVLGIIDRAQISSYKESVRSVFEATNLYLASNNFQDLPAGGISVTDTKIQIKNKEFTSGKIIKNEEGNLELDKVSNGRFCAGGTFENIFIIEGSCDLLDITPPTIDINSNLVTSSSVTIVATSEDLESGINGYQFSKDNGTTWTTKQTSNVYTFSGLTNGMDYSFKVKVFNNNNIASISDTLIIRTTDIAIPTYSIDTTDWSSSKVVTITYPARQTGYVYEYSLDNALTWETVVDPAITKDITFNTNGNVIARIFDGTNEISGASYAVTNIDIVNPVVSFSVNGNVTYAKSRTTTVSVTDVTSGVLVSSLKYLWSTSAIAPTEEDFSLLFTNGVPLSTPAGQTGGYYLWILSKDNAGNTLITRSNIFNLDNTLPVITINPTSITQYIGSSYSDTGVTASDDTNGDITANIIKTGSVNTAVVGSYILTYNVSDGSGNAALVKTRTVNIINYTYTFSNAEATGMSGPTQAQLNIAYSGTLLQGTVTSSSGIQLWTVPSTKTYRIEVWGAQGGTTSGYLGGLGARMRGDFNLTAGQQLSILVGQVGNIAPYASGGGASGVWISNAAQPLIIAGGGGGANRVNNPENGKNAVVTSSGTSSYGAGGTGGNGGSVGYVYTGGGAGWLTNGGGDYPAIALKNGAMGGIYDTPYYGTFGGGGVGFGGGGGGGGYSGGGGGHYDTTTPGVNSGGGGGSYNSGTNQSNTAGTNTSNGRVVIIMLP